MSAFRIPKEGEKNQSVAIGSKAESTTENLRSLRRTPVLPVPRYLLGKTFDVEGGLSVGIQPKLKVGPPGDPREEEADRAAGSLSSDPAADESLGRPPAHARRAQGQGDENSSTVDRVLSEPGTPLQTETRHEMESRFGYDFSQVRVHNGREAEESARGVNAEAFTLGHHIVFGAGRYLPETHAGRRLIAHELTHVVQQSRGGNLIQRLIRTPYPWTGVIVPAAGAHIRSSPDASNPANILDSIPRGQTVKVLSTSGEWLQVESRFRGPVLTGYIKHTLVDDATSSAMSGGVGTTMVWKPSGPGSGTTFESWASAATETPFPPVTAATVMNCWEAVMLSGYRAGVISWNWFHQLYVSTPLADWVNAMSRGPRHPYSIPGPNPTMPQRGDLVFFNGISHVALATGNGSNVYTFWPPPNTPFAVGGTTDKVKIFTIEALSTWWAANLPPAPTIEFGAPAW